MTHTITRQANNGMQNSPIGSEPAPVKATLTQKVKTAFSEFVNIPKYLVYQGFWHRPKHEKENQRMLTAIGGENYNLKSADGGKISMTYLSTSNFVSAVKQAGGKSATLTSANDPTLLVKALSFESTKAKDFLNSLRGTTFFDAGWRTIKDGGKTYLVSQEDYQNLVDHQLVNGKTQVKGQGLQIQEAPYELNHVTPKTVILCPGIRGRKESLGTIEDMAAYLIHGAVNVVMFDYRGTGNSRGHISHTGMMMDLESIHSFLKARVEGIQCRDITVVGTCFGAGPATRFAAKYPVNLILNQPYANIEEFAQEQILKQNDTGLSNLIPKRMQQALFQQFGPKYNVPQDLQHVKGHIAIIFNKSDEDVATSHDVSNIDAFPSNQKGQIIKAVLVGGIKHGAGWHSKPDNSLPLKSPRVANSRVDEEGHEWTMLSSEPERFDASMGKEQIIDFLKQTGMCQDQLLNSL